LEADAERIGPGDVGAAIGVVADPACEDDGAWLQGGPAVGPGESGAGEKCDVELVEGVAAVDDGLGGAVELLIEGNGVGAVGGKVGRGGDGVGGERGECLVGGFGQGEGWMGGEDRGIAGALCVGAELGPWDGTIEGIGAEDFLGCGLEGLAVGGGVCGAEIGGKAAGAADERLVTEGADEGGSGRGVELMLVDEAGDSEGDREDGVPEGLIAGLGEA
jgi:hypothetical protein